MSQPTSIESSPVTATPADANAATRGGAAAAVPTPAASETNPIANTPTEEASQTWLWLTKLDQSFVTLLVAALLALTGYHWATLGGWGMQPIEIERQPERQFDFRIDINSASWVEWTQIEGIGEATANKIVAEIGRAHV